MGKTSKIVAPDWLADKLLSAMNFGVVTKDASFDFLRAVEPTSPKSINTNLKLDNE
jgi:hypothetical protein